MIICPSCSTPNLEGMFFCEECGSAFVDIQTNKGGIKATPKTNMIKTQVFDASATPTHNEMAKLTVGTTSLSSDTRVRIHFQGSDNITSLNNQSEVIVGRSDENKRIYPDIDLTPHGALDKGVSRRHAVIRRSQDHLTITDLGSANGTFVNGRQVFPNQPHILRDGDELRFGKLVSHIYFAKT